MDINFDSIKQGVIGHEFWPSYLNHVIQPISQVGIHIAIFSEPFLTFLLDGRKTIESRFSRNRCAPFGEVADGDVILIKEVAGPICGLALAKQTWYFDLAHKPLDAIKDQYADRICADDSFWELRRSTSYATLIDLDETAAIAPVWCDKRDRRGWVSLRSRQLKFAF